MNKSEFLQYLNENFNITRSTYALIYNILTYAENITDENEQYIFLCFMLDGTIGLTDNEIKNINL